MQGEGEMIDHMHQRLLRWADWSALGRRAAGLWFARCSLAVWHASGESLLPDVRLDEEASDTDRAVTQLPDDLRDAVRAMYLGRGTVEQRARDCHCHRITLYSRVARAQQRMVGLLDAMRVERVQAVDAQKLAKWGLRCRVGNMSKKPDPELTDDENPEWTDEDSNE